MGLARAAHLLTLLLGILAAGTIAAQESSDTARYAILFSDRNAGYYKE